MNTNKESSALEALMGNPIIEYIIKIAWAVIVIALLLVISKVIASFVRSKIIKWTSSDNKHIDKIWDLVHDITFYILVIFSFFVWFEMVGFNVWLILWWISFGVWLAFKEVLGNMIAGIMILYTKEFKLWDVVEIQSDQNYFWRIEEITIRYTVIRTLDLRQVVIPNMTLISVPIKTFSAEALVRLSILFWIWYNSDLTKAIDLITETIKWFDFVKEKTNTKVFLSSFGDSSIEIKGLFLFDPNCGLLPDIAIWNIYQKINTVFSENGIDIPYNYMTVNFDPSTKEALAKLKE